MPCRLVRAGQSASLSIGNQENITEKLRKVHLYSNFYFSILYLFQIHEIFEGNGDCE